MAKPEFVLLSRDEFREAVFSRDSHKCVVCGEPAKDAHHIIERRLFSADDEKSGYFLQNGASVCNIHHLEAEQTIISCDTLRELCGIKSFPIPSHFYKDQETDKWGNPILPNGMRLKGELFDDPSVQKILAPVLHLFTERVKYPRTYHLPWSPGVTKDDRVQNDLSSFVGKDVVVTVKHDGECSSLYHDYIHARSIEYNPHESRSWLKTLHAKISHDIPKGMRICGENLYAKHSIKYENLEDYFLVFSIWNDKNVCLSWKDTCEWASLFDLKVVPALYEGIWNENKIRTLYKSTFNGDPCEGYVVRLTDSFHYKEFRRAVLKFVRKNHVQTTHGHWMRNVVEPNKIKE